MRATFPSLLHNQTDVRRGGAMVTLLQAHRLEIGLHLIANLTASIRHADWLFMTFPQEFIISMSHFDWVPLGEEEHNLSADCSAREKSPPPSALCLFPVFDWICMYYGGDSDEITQASFLPSPPTFLLSQLTEFTLPFYTCSVSHHREKATTLDGKVRRNGS